MEKVVRADKNGVEPEYWCRVQRYVDLLIGSSSLISIGNVG